MIMGKVTLGVRVKSAIKLIVGIIIGGAISSTAVAVFAISLFRVDRFADPYIDILGDVAIVSPQSGAVVGWSAPVVVSTAGYREIFKIDVFARRAFDPVLLGSVKGSGNIRYTIPISTVALTDHGFDTMYAVIYPVNSEPVTTDIVHIQIDRCATDETCLKVTNTANASLTDLTPGQEYQLYWKTKTAYEDNVSIKVTDKESGNILRDCSSATYAKDWYPSPYCSFRATSSEATLMFSLSEYRPDDIFIYLDDVTIETLDEYPVAIDPTSSLWSGENLSRVTLTPITNRKPFAPSRIYSVDSNLPISSEQNLGMWFFKGSPRSHYTWWTKIGKYERPPLSYDSDGAYEFFAGSEDTNKWYSPLMIWFTRETTNPDSFSYTNGKVSVTTDKGAVDICLPDLTWENPVLNGISITGLVVDEFGNTYYANRYNDPDFLTYDHVAKLCTCTDGTAIGQCTSGGTQFCNESGQLEHSDCRTCGCSATRESCEEQDNGSYACEIPFVDRLEEISL